MKTIRFFIPILVIYRKPFILNPFIITLGTWRRIFEAELNKKESEVFQYDTEVNVKVSVVFENAAEVNMKVSEVFENAAELKKYVVFNSVSVY